MKNLMKCVVHYMQTGEHYEFDTMEEQREYQKVSTKMLLAGGGDTIREMATLAMIHAKPVEGKHDWDGLHGKTFVEVKNETMSEKGKFGGKGIFNNLTWRSYEKYSKGGIYLQGCYGRDGILVAVVAFRIEHLLPKLHKALTRVMPNGDVSGKNVTINISASDFPEETELVYLREDAHRSLFPKAMWALMAVSYANGTKIKGRSYLKTEKKSKVKFTNQKETAAKYTKVAEMVRTIYNSNIFTINYDTERIEIGDTSVKLSSLKQRYRRVIKNKEAK